MISGFGVAKHDQLTLHVHSALGQTSVALVSGATFDLATALPGADPGGSVRAQVSEHPTRPGVLGLRNVGSAPWSATLRDGSTQLIPIQRNIRLAQGVAIEFVPGVTAQVSAQ